MGLQFTGPTPHGFTWGLVLLKDLPKTTNTVWCFHAQIKNGRKWTMMKTTGFKIRILWVQYPMELRNG
jgi:hypothetical protein